MLFFLFFLKSVNRSGAFFDFCVCVPKIVQSYFPSQSFSPKVVQSFNSKIVQSFSRSVVQSFNHIYIHIVEMGYFAVHGTIWHRVLCGARYYMVHGWQFFLIPSDAKQRTNILKKVAQTNKAKKKQKIM